eukprot:TRINITY_DN3252_c0_g1_i3.p1 TRINITY_DN3252_c0_g1~~TRINITY_DN3252_c0_g1_i3.p1  ORF type:complete len:287 (-),score=48.44 TRINITY_DN3252_c0_g1_i3:115-975(-)
MVCCHMSRQITRGPALLVALTIAFRLASPSAFVGFQWRRGASISKMLSENVDRETHEHWKDLVSDPSSWWDNRDTKRSPDAPDFKQKDGDITLWLDSCPDELLDDVPVSTRQRWEDVISNPHDWWDNRETKNNPRAPDFKKKDKDVALWLNTCPDELLEQIDNLPRRVSLRQQQWEDVISNPDDWWDIRENKRNPRAPDLKKKDDSVALWLDTCPDELLDQIDNLPKPVSIRQHWENVISNPDEWWDNREDKRNPRAPDFKMKNEDVALWLNSCPEDLLLQLPNSV